MIPDNVIELERRRSEHRERDQTVQRMQKRIVELEAQVRELRCEVERLSGRHVTNPFAP